MNGAGRMPHVGVIGLGYVGLPLAVSFAEAGFQVTGVDVDQYKVRGIHRGHSPVQDLSSGLLKRVLREGRFKVSTHYSSLANTGAVVICVPTPLNKSKDPDLSFIVKATEHLVRFLRRGQLIVLESTTYPGTTREVLQPILEKSGLEAGKDFALVFSPERIDPGNKRFTLRTTPKVVGGLTPTCAQRARDLYSAVVNHVVTVSSPETAEMVKLLENTFRAVNIGLVNEFALMSRRLGMNVWEVIEAAATKPFGFMPFYPGPGIGGHCIPLDPHYLSWKLRSLNFNARFIGLAEEINSRMPEYVVERIREALNIRGKPIRRSRILVVGVTYKKDIDDVRESPALDILDLLERNGARIAYHDPYVPSLRWGRKKLTSQPLTRAVISSQDCVAVITDHTRLDRPLIASAASLVFDARNAFRDVSGPSKVVRL